MITTGWGLWVASLGVPEQMACALAAAGGVAQTDFSGHWEGAVAIFMIPLT
jgi:hypothetical protein